MRPSVGNVLVCLFSASLPGGQTASSARPIRDAYIDKTGYVHVVRGDGKDIQISGEKHQVSAASPAVAPDHRTVGWLVEVPNCCTSYPIPTTLVIYRSGRVVQHIADGMMIYKWAFLDGGRRVAVSSGTVHGMTRVHLTLYDSRTGGILRTWDGAEGEAPPEWGARLVR
jgi:hypothetical protein